jgi:hypothetical protein
MTAAGNAATKRIGRRPKHKDAVLGFSMSVCITRPLAEQIASEAQRAGCTRPELVRTLLCKGLAAWRAEPDKGILRSA